MKQQSAVEFLITQISKDTLGKSFIATWKQEFEQAKQIEKKQMVDFLKWTEGVYSFGNVNGLWYEHINTNLEYTTEELYIKYYNETFKTK